MILFPTEYQDIYFSSGLFVTNSLSNINNNSVRFFIERYTNERINCTSRDVSLIRGEEVRGWRLENAEIADVPHSVTAAARAAAVLQLALCRIFNCWTAAQPSCCGARCPGRGNTASGRKGEMGQLVKVCWKCVSSVTAGPLLRDHPRLRNTAARQISLVTPRISVTA